MYRYNTIQYRSKPKAEHLHKTFQNPLSISTRLSNQCMSRPVIIGRSKYFIGSTYYFIKHQSGLHKSDRNAELTKQHKLSCRFNTLTEKYSTTRQKLSCQQQK